VLSGQVQGGAYNAIDSTKNTTLGNLASSRTFIAVSATEDMGGGVKAGVYAQLRYKTETGAMTGTGIGANYANKANGTSSAFEQSKLFISSSYGQLNAGKYTTNLGVAQGWVSPMGDDGALSARAATEVPRQEAQVSYVSPTWNGLTVEILKAYRGAGSGNAYLYEPGTVDTVSTALGTVTKDLTQNSITYVAGPVKAFFGQTNRYDSAKNQQYGVAYNLNNVVTLMASQDKWKDGTTTSSQYTAVANDTLTSLAAQVPYGKWNFGIAYVESDKTDYTRKSVSAEYNLSNRTKFMAQWAKAEKDSVATKNGTGTYVGLAHAF
jgi:hypothetical protein